MKEKEEKHSETYLLAEKLMLVKDNLRPPVERVYIDEAEYQYHLLSEKARVLWRFDPADVWKYTDFEPSLGKKVMLLCLRAELSISRRHEIAAEEIGEFKKETAVVKHLREEESLDLPKPGISPVAILKAFIPK